MLFFINCDISRGILRCEHADAN